VKWPSTAAAPDELMGREAEVARAEVVPALVLVLVPVVVPIEHR